MPEGIDGLHFADQLNLKSTLFELSSGDLDEPGVVPGANRAAAASARTRSPAILQADAAGRRPLGRARLTAVAALLMAWWATIGFKAGRGRAKG